MTCHLTAFDWTKIWHELKMYPEEAARGTTAGIGLATEGRVLPVEPTGIYLDYTPWTVRWILDREQRKQTWFKRWRGMSSTGGSY
jgi:hypothetical protein